MTRENVNSGEIQKRNKGKPSGYNLNWSNANRNFFFFFFLMGRYKTSFSFFGRPSFNEASNKQFLCKMGKQNKKQTRCSGENETSQPVSPGSWLWIDFRDVGKNKSKNKNQLRCNDSGENEKWSSWLWIDFCHVGKNKTKLKPVEVQWQWTKMKNETSQPVPPRSWLWTQWRQQEPHFWKVAKEWVGN